MESVIVMEKDTIKPVQKEPASQQTTVKMLEDYIKVRVSRDGSIAEFKVIKDDLASLCRSFKEIVEKAKNGLICFDDVTPRSFEILLKYIDVEEVSVRNIDELEEVWELAQKHDILTLSDLCRTVWRSFLSPSTACRVFRTAHNWDDDSLRWECLELFESETLGVINSETFKKATFETVESITQSRRLTLNNEGQLFTAVVQWGKEQCKRQKIEPTPKNIRSIIAPLLMNIRFLDMSPEEFVRHVVTEKILTESEERSILINNLGIDYVALLPRDLCYNHNSRLLVDCSFLEVATASEPTNGLPPSSDTTARRPHVACGAIFKLVMEVTKGTIQLEELDLPLFDEVTRNPVALRVTLSSDNAKTGYHYSKAFNSTIDKMSRFIYCCSLQVKAGETATIMVQAMDDVRARCRVTAIDLPSRVKLNDTEIILKENTGAPDMYIRRVHIYYKAKFEKESGSLCTGY